MAKSPDHYTLLTEHGVTRLHITYLRPFRQTIRVEIPERPKS